MNIVCGTDFSDSARRAATVAATLATRSEDTLLLLHLLEGGGAGALSGELHDSLCAITNEQLQTEAERLRGLGATVKPELLAGWPDTAIVQKALPASTRLIVVSARSEEAPRTPGLGSVAERIAESSPVPTLVVRRAEPFAAWTRAERPLRILCAYDFTTTGDAALTYLQELRRFGPCDVVVAHVDSPLEEKARFGFPGPAPFDGNQPEVQRILERDLKEKVDATLGEAGARIRVKGNWGRPDHDLIEMANLEQADLIVTGAHQRHGLERLFHMSVSRALLRYAPMNVLVVPVTREPMKTLPAVPHRVLVATDFSDVGNQAVRHAYSLLRAGGIVRLVHVTHPQALRSGEYEQRLGDRHSQGQHAEHLRACTDQLRSLVPADAATRGIVTEVEVLEHEKPALAIAQAAERCGASVICMATHGCSRFSAALSGSVTQAVMSRSVRPLLVVHAEPE